MKEEQVKLGHSYRDTITGFVGVCTSITQFLTGCARVGLQSAKLKDEKPIDVQYFDAVSIEEAEVDIAISLRDKIKKPSGEKPGGPNPVPSAREVPRR